MSVENGTISDYSSSDDDVDVAMIEENPPLSAKTPFDS